MDPDANLNEQLILAKSMLDHPNSYNLGQADRLAELVVALDKWMCDGGMPPKRWKEGLIKLMYQTNRR